MKTSTRNPAIVLPMAVVAVSAILGLAIVFGAPITNTQVEKILIACWAIGILAAYLITGVVVDHRTVPTVDVTEYVDQHGQVRAGPANELPTDTHVRTLGAGSFPGPEPRYAVEYPTDFEDMPDVPVVAVTDDREVDR